MLRYRSFSKKELYHKKMFSYFYFYNFLFSNMRNALASLVKKKKKKDDRSLYHLILTFKNNKLFINLHDYIKRNYLFISNGLFIRFYEKKKSLKKSKIIRTVVAKYLRKFFLLLKLPRVILIIKKNPVFFLEFLNLFMQPIVYKFNEPLTNREIRDKGPLKFLTKFLYFVFVNNENYVNNKEKKKGRIKRKISRKIILQNHIID